MDVMALSGSNSVNGRANGLKCRNFATCPPHSAKKRACTVTKRLRRTPNDRVTRRLSLRNSCERSHCSELLKPLLVECAP